MVTRGEMFGFALGENQIFEGEKYLVLLFLKTCFVVLIRRQ